jgi:hypothetical protein
MFNVTMFFRVDGMSSSTNAVIPDMSPIQAKGTSARCSPSPAK